MTDQLVTVIIPVYNAEKYLPRTIDSVLRQSYTNWELLLVDDCSTDHSRELMQQYEKQYDNVHCYYCEKNGGPAQARNLGIDHAQGQYLAFVDSDDLWVPHKLERQLMFLKKHDYAFTFTSYEFADENAVSKSSNIDNDDFKPSEEEINKTKEYYNNAIADYEKYLEISSSSSDANDVQSKIEDIQTRIKQIEEGKDTN